MVEWCIFYWKRSFICAPVRTVLWRKIQLRTNHSFIYILHQCLNIFVKHGKFFFHMFIISKGGNIDMYEADLWSALPPLNHFLLNKQILILSLLFCNYWPVATGSCSWKASTLILLLVTVLHKIAFSLVAWLYITPTSLVRKSNTCGNWQCIIL